MVAAMVLTFAWTSWRVNNVLFGSTGCETPAPRSGTPFTRLLISEGMNRLLSWTPLFLL